MHPAVASHRVSPAIDPVARLQGWPRCVYEATMIALAVAVVVLLPLEPEGWVHTTNLTT